MNFAAGGAGAGDGLPASLGQAEGMFHAIWPSQLGRIPDEFSNSLLATFGRQLARLHRSRQPGQGFAHGRPDGAGARLW